MAGGVESGVAFRPAVPGLAPRAFMRIGLGGHKSPQRELGDGTCGISGVESGVALGPAVPGLAPRGFYADRASRP